MSSFHKLPMERFTVKLQETGYQVLLLHVESGYSIDAVIVRLISHKIFLKIAITRLCGFQITEESEGLDL